MPHVEALPRTFSPRVAKTIYDIAREAQVGIGTVSRVFNNHPSVSPETRQRVLSIARKFRYQPHPYARGLARRRTNTILVIVPYISSFFVEILQSVQERVYEAECDLVLHGVSHLQHGLRSLTKVTSRGRFDGVICVSLPLPDDFVREILQLKVPLVLVDTEDQRFDSFNVDNVEGSYRATTAMIERGHRRIGFICANLESKPARDRLTGYRRALTEHRMTYDESIVRMATSPRLDGFTREEGYALAGSLIGANGTRPTALVISSDIQASGVLEALREHSIRCPEEVEVVGYDDIELARHLGLSTMRQPLEDMGRLAIKRLLERIDQASLPVVHKTFVPELVERSTTIDRSGAVRREEQLHSSLY